MDALRLSREALMVRSYLALFSFTFKVIREFCILTDLAYPTTNGVTFLTYINVPYCESQSSKMTTSVTVN